MATLDLMDSLEPKPEIMSQTQTLMFTLPVPALQKRIDIVRPSSSIVIGVLQYTFYINPVQTKTRPNFHNIPNIHFILAQNKSRPGLI